MKATKPIGFSSWSREEQTKWFNDHFIESLDQQTDFAKNAKKLKRKLVYGKPEKHLPELTRPDVVTEELLSLKSIFSHHLK
jgi:hypothetical protein